MKPLHNKIETEIIKILKNNIKDTNALNYPLTTKQLIIDTQPLTQLQPQYKEQIQKVWYSVLNKKLAPDIKISKQEFQNIWRA